MTERRRNIFFTLSLSLFAALFAAASEASAADLQPLYRIPLRVHLGGSSRPVGDFTTVLGEINRIWAVGAAICFDMEVVHHDDTIAAGFDLWFVPEVGGRNGYFDGPHSIRVRDFPRLAHSGSPAADPAARTAAHELGHALGLLHRQDSDDNLMRSKTFGWLLNEEERARARHSAALLGKPASGPCLSRGLK